MGGFKAMDIRKVLVVHKNGGDVYTKMIPALPPTTY
jgi:hypothetical protein